MRDLDALAEMNSEELIQIIASNMSDCSLKDLDLILSAVKKATALHSHQIRKTPGVKHSDVPYIVHPLRNTVRLMWWGVTDVDILVASVLHDTVEDCSEQYVRLLRVQIDGVDSSTFNNAVDVPMARSLLSENIRELFGDKVVEIVSDVTNPYHPFEETKDWSRAQKREIYIEKVLSVVERSNEAFLVKVSDFIDNAGFLFAFEQNNNKGFVKRLAQKYAPLVTPLRLMLMEKNLENYLSRDALGDIDYRLECVGISLKKIRDAE